MGDGAAGKYIEGFARRCRKEGGALITGTQSLEDFYSTAGARACIENSDWSVVLRLKPEALEQFRKSDRLQADDGRIVEIVAMDEVVSTVRCADPWRLARASYHLGNRHVPVQIGAGWLRFRHDHVLDEMLRGQGYTVTVEEAPFEPEGGAYGGSHGHAHD